MMLEITSVTVGRKEQQNANGLMKFGFLHTIEEAGELLIMKYPCFGQC